MRGFGKLLEKARKEVFPGALISALGDPGQALTSRMGRWSLHVVILFCASFFLPALGLHRAHGLSS